MNDTHENLGITALLIGLIFAVIIGGLFGLYGFAGFAKNFHRHQKLADARNQVQLNSIQIQQTKQLVQVQQQKAQIKIAEAHGIEEAQRIINNTLTPLYLQHEAIQAQESQSNKIIYVPAGNQGIPIVNAVNP
jgi:Na+/glutamate symporter